MANYWAIAIGINQYQALQPLMYAQWDAFALYRYWIDDGGFDPQQCRLLTDTSPPIAGYATVPDRNTIQHHIVQICQQQVQPGDVLWVFFSGYAVQENGRDYLMPTDGDPAQPVATGIPVSELFATLKTAPTQSILVLLDLKRADGGTIHDSLLGSHTAAIAQEHDLAVILASRPEQFSHETLALRQGLFTAALLEGLRTHGCVTLEHLVQYLGDRLPQLSEQHWRPSQNPVSIIPDDLRYQLIVPGKPPLTEPPSSPETPFPEVPPPGVPFPEQAFPNAPDLQQPPSEEPSPLPPLVPVPTPTPPPAPPVQSSPGDGSGVAEQPMERIEDDGFWRRLIKWGGILVALLLAGVLVRNWSAFWGEPDSPNAPEGPSGMVEPMAPAGAGAAATPGGGSTPLDLSNPGSLSAAQVQPGGGAEGEGVNQPPLVAAQMAIANGQSADALRWLDRVPASEQDDTYADLRAEAEQLNRQVRQTNEAILAQAIASMNQAREAAPVNQASDFHRAITQATRIRPGQPLYEEAQQHIQRWSQVILDLAEARAKTGNYADAVTAAQLVPPSQGRLRQVADQWIAQWQESADQATASQQVLAQAQALIQPGQPESYQEAIAQLRSVPPEQPGYESIRAQIDEWGREILNLAYSQAEADNLYEAVNTAALVPDDAAVYLEAQEAILGWRQQLRGN